MNTGKLNVLDRMKKLLNRIVDISAWVPFFILGIAEGSVPILRFLRWMGLTKIEFNAAAMEIKNAFSGIAFVWIIIMLINVLKRLLEARPIESGTIGECVKKAMVLCGEVRTIDVYAYSAKNYLKVLDDYISRCRKANIRLLLCRVNEFIAWYSHDSTKLATYESEIENAISTMKSWQDSGFIKKGEIRFLDDRLLTHFCVINGKYVVAGVLPLRVGGVPSAGSHDGGSCCFLNPTIGDVVERYAKTFETWFTYRGFYDSGLKRRSPSSCMVCRDIIEEKVLNNRGTCAYVDFVNSPLLDKNMLGLDFYVLPDCRPISKVHLVLMCKYHVLTLYDYFRRIKTEDGQSKTKYALHRLIMEIRKTVKSVFGDDEDILVFEHGSLRPSSLSTPSLNHMHLHVILKKDLGDGFSIQNLIQKDSERLQNNGFCSVVEWDVDRRMNLPHRYLALDDFAEAPEMGGRDYLLVWDVSKYYSEAEDERKGVLVYLMQEFSIAKDQNIPDEKDVRQYFRRLFFSALDANVRKGIYGGDYTDDVWMNIPGKDVETTKANQSNYNRLKDAFASIDKNALIEKRDVVR